MESFNSINEAAVIKRRKMRKASAESRSEQLEAKKAEGNDAFKSGDYKEAARIYVSAIQKFGPKSVLCSNLAAALGKLELWNDVEYTATLALKANPRMSKARFRRAMARKALKQYHSAIVDFDNIVKNDPSLKEAATELEAVNSEWDELVDSGNADNHNIFSGDLYDDDEWPRYQDNAMDYESDSDTEDCLHEGNHTACRYYNHGGCSRGNLCAYSHSPDDKSIRDELGKNVCLRFLVGNCKFGDASCIYSHDKRYLKPPQWWDVPSTKEMAERLVTAVEGEFFNFLPAFARHPYSRYVGKRTHKAYINSKLREVIGRVDLAKVPPKAVDPKLSAATPNPASSTSFVLLISLNNESWFSESYARLLRALSSKRKVVQALDPRDALDKLSSPDLDGVIVTDAGITERKALSVMQRLIEYVKSGGRLVIGCMFSSFITGGDFKSFFRSFGLSWQRGSYHRATFFLNPRNHVVVANPSLVKSYSMKALHVDGITPEMAVYQPTSESVTQSLVFAPEQVKKLDEAPIVIAPFGKGYIGYVGDVNAEDESTDAYLAMLRLLDEHSAASAPPAPAAPVASTSTAGNPRAAASTSLAQKAAVSAPSKTPVASASNLKDATLVVVLLDGKNSNFTKTFSRQISLFQSKSKVETILTRATLEERLTSSKPIRGIYLADAGILRNGNQTLLPRISEFAKFGGTVVVGGLFPSVINVADSEQLFSAFGLGWSSGSYGRFVYEVVPTAELAKKNPSLPETFSAKALNIKHIPPEALVYLHVPESDDEEFGGDRAEPFDAPVLRARVGRGAVGYIGDVNGEEETDSILLAMFGLLDPQSTAIPERQPKKFALFLSFGDEEYVDRAYGPVLKKLEENLEVVRGLSVERMADLVSSPDLTAVFVSSALIANPAYTYVLHRLIEFTTEEGGTVVFLEGFARQVTPPECRPFFLDAWGLDWTTAGSYYPVENVRFNGKNSLVVSGRQLPDKPDLSTAHTMASSNPDDLVYMPKRLNKDAGTWNTKGGRYSGPALYSPVSEKGRVGYLGSVSSEVDYVELLLAMAGVVPPSTIPSSSLPPLTGIIDADA